jgi:nucleoside-diphosphate-sugar epimerase
MLEIINNECYEIVNNIDFSSLKNKKVLITGASGIIGVYMLSCLQQVRKDFDVGIYCWVNSDIDPIFQDLFKDCVIIKGDICSESLLDGMQDHLSETLCGFDMIIHAAGYAQPNKFLENKVKTIQLNTNSTTRLFNMLNNGGTFVFMSTSEVYSGLDNDNISENDIGTSRPDHPRSCYIEGKRCGESICHAFSNENANVKIIRLSLAYGPGTKKNDQRVLNSLFQKAFETGKINLLDSGSSMRTYGYISDIIEMIWNISLYGKQIVYNVAGQSKTSIFDLAKQISSLTNVPINAPADDSSQLAGVPKNVNLNLERYFTEFNKTNFVSLEEGLKRTMEWQKGLYVK